MFSGIRVISRVEGRIWTDWGIEQWRNQLKILSTINDVVYREISGKFENSETKRKRNRDAYERPAWFPAFKRRTAQIRLINRGEIQTTGQFSVIAEAVHKEENLVSKVEF